MSFVVFIFLTVSHYFSRENVIHINKSRSIYSLKSYMNLPLLKNDTNNIIKYLNDVEVYKKEKKKFSFFDLIKK